MKEKTPKKRVEPTTEAALREMLKRTKKPVLVQFYSPGCGACHANKQEIDAAAAALDGVAEVVRINGDTSPKLADELKVTGYPESFVYQGGKVVKRIRIPKKAPEYVAEVKKVTKE